MVDGATTSKKQQPSGGNKSFNEQNQSKIVLRHLPPTLTSEQFLENVSPLPDHDYYRFCKADLSLGQQYSFSRAYLNIPNPQDLIVFVEKFQGYVFLDKNGNEYICIVEYAPNQSRPKSDQQTRKDPKVNSIEQDPDYQTFVANMNAPVSGADALPNPETMLEEIEKRQRDLHDTKNKPGATTTPLLEYLKRKREERRQEKSIRIQQNPQRRSNKQQARNEDSRPSTARTTTEDDYYGSTRYGGGGDRSNRRQQRGYDKGDYRNTHSEQKRSNAHESSSKSNKQPNSKGKQQQKSSETPKESKNQPTPKLNTEELPQTEHQPKRDSASAEATNITSDNTQHDERPNSSNKSLSSGGGGQKGMPKNRPSIQIYNPSERARMRRQQNPSS